MDSFVGFLLLERIFENDLFVKYLINVVQRIDFVVKNYVIECLIKQKSNL